MSRVAILAIFSLSFMAFSVAASPTSDIADGLNDALFGGSNLFAAQSILTAAVVASVGFPLAMLHLNPTATFIILFCIICALTAIGWADPTILLIAGLVAVGMAVRVLVPFWTGDGGSSSDD